MTDRFQELEELEKFHELEEDKFHELEELVGRRLQQLPAPRAPETLAANVLRAVRTAAPASAPAGWAGWPLAWKTAVGAALAVLVLGVIQIWPAIDATLALGWSRVGDAVGPHVESITDGIAPFFTAGRVIWRVVVQPIGLVLVVFIAVMGAACAAFGTAWRHVAFGGITR